MAGMFKKLITSKALRSRTSWILAFVLVPPFIFFFHLFSGSSKDVSGGAAGTLFGRPVSAETFQLHHQWIRRQWLSRLQEIPAIAEPMLRQAAWDRLVLLEEAARRGLQVTDGELSSSIHAIEAFQENGWFVRDRYDRVLRALGLNPQSFETLLRADLLIDRLMTDVRNAVLVTDAALWDAYVAERERRAGTAWRFDSSGLAVTEPTEEELRAAYEGSPERFRRPEQLRGEVAGWSREVMADMITPTEDELRAFDAAHGESATGPDDPGASFEARREDLFERYRAREIRRRLNVLAIDLEEDVKAARAFDDLVSARGLSRQAFGPIDAGATWVPGGPEPAVLDAVQSLAAGQLSRVVETEGGVYVARLTERLPARVPPFEDVRAQVLEEALDARRLEAARSAAQAFQAFLAEQQARGVRIEEAMLAAALTDGRAAAFPVEASRGQALDALEGVSAATEALFAVALGQISGVLDLPGGFALIRPERIVPADPEAFASEREVFREQLTSRRQSEHVQSWLEQLRADANIGDSHQFP